MGSLRRVLALARFEARLNLRLIRGWVLGGLATIFAAVSAAYYLVLHRLFSGYSAPYAFITKDLWVLQTTVFLGMVLGVFGVFYAFDWRHRDQAAHFAATLDASPLTRLEQAWGKFLGLCVLLAWPFAVLLVGQLVGMAIAGVWLPPVIFVVSLLGYGLPMALAPTALAFGLAGLFRNQGLARLLAIVVPFGWLALTIGAGVAMPERVAVVLGALTELPFHSDFVGYEAGAMSMLQRVSAWLIVATFASLAAMGPLGLPRDAREKASRFAIVGGLAAALAATFFGIFMLYDHADRDRKAILAAEEAARREATAIVVVQRRIDVTVEPGSRLEGRALLDIRPADGAAWPTHAVLRLNAGLRVDSAEVNGRSAEVTRDHTVVRIALPPLAPGDPAELNMLWSGVPTPRSADAGTALAEVELSGQDRNNRRFLGNVPLFFDRKSVVLPMDAAWYPDPALILGARYPDIERPSLAPGTLTVTLPAGWTAAGVGARSVTGDRATFTSEVPVPGFCLVAAAYEERVADLDGLTIRLLYLPEHARNVELFADAKEELLARARERLADVRAATGLAYPHPELHLVDVPQQMGVHASGWEASNRLGQPGVVLLREGQLFRARFEHALESKRKEALKAAGGGAPQASGASGPAPASGASGPAPASGASGPAAASGASGPAAASARAAAQPFDERRAKREILERFSSTDFTGGDVERLVMRSAWDHRVRPVGDGAALLGVALPSFVAEAALGRYVVDTPEMARVIQSAVGETVQLLQSNRSSEIGEVIMKAIADPDTVWALMQETPLEKLDPAGKPADFAGVLFVKGRQPFLALRETLGREPLAAALSSLVDPAGASTLTWASLRAAVVAQATPEQAPGLERLFDDWLGGTAIAGFVVERGRTWRLPGEAERWQAVAVVSNRGSGGGTARLRIGQGDDAMTRLLSVAAGEEIEVGAVVPVKPERWSLNPYLALNRTRPDGSFDVLEQPEWTDAFEGSRPAPPPVKPVVVVDNVDEGFSLTLDDRRVAWMSRDEDGDRELGMMTVLWRAPGSWRRWTPRSVSSYRPFGYFDQSAAVKKATEDGGKPAIWTATLPSAGTWRVDAYLPPARNLEGAKPSKTFAFVVKDQGGDKPVELALEASQPGWNDLGRFSFGTTAEVHLLDKGKGLILADAVRFTRD